MDVPKTLDHASIEEHDLVSRYIGQKLSPEEAEAFEEHYFGCDRCWEEVQAATEVRAALSGKVASQLEKGAGTPEQAPVIRGPWRNPALLAAAAAGAVIALAGIFVWRAAPARLGKETGLASLVAAVGEARPVEPRLTGGFAYAPFRRSAETSPTTPSWEVLAEAARIKKAAEANPSTERLHELGIAHLVLGEAGQAVSRLEEALLQSPDDAGLQSDLAAAYLVQAETENRPDAVVKALSAAEKAVQLNPSGLEAYFNRAVALERLSMKEKARQAWIEYIRRDPDSGWADEAKERKQAVSPHASSRLWEDERDRLLQAAKRSDWATVRQVVELFAQTTRELVEERLLPDWADAVQNGSRSADQDLLKLCRGIVRVHTEVSGDPMLADVVEAIGRSISSGDTFSIDSHARGLLHFRQGKGLLDRLDSEAALARLTDARNELRRAGSPFAAWPEFYLTICAYYRGDLSLAAAEAGRLRLFAQTSGYRNLLGRTSWMLGLIALVRDEINTAADHYRTALSCFVATKESGHRTAVDSLLAGAMARLGELSESWRYRLHALEWVANGRDPRRAHRVYSDAALASLAQDLPLPALAFQDAALATAASWESPLVTTEAHLYRALILHALGRNEETSEEFLAARASFGGVQDESLETRLSAEVSAAEGMIESRTQPTSAEQSLGRALNYFRSTDSGVRLPELYLARGRARLAAGKTDSAAADLLAGISEFERQRKLQGPFRISYFDRAWDLFDELIRLEALHRNDPVQALLFVERTRARDLLDAIERNDAAAGAEETNQGPLDPAGIQASLPGTTTLVYYVALEDRVLSWVVTAKSIQFFQNAVGSGDLSRRVETYRRALERDAPRKESDHLASALFDDLIRPLKTALPADSVLIFIPDGLIGATPFAGLLDAKLGRYLVEDHASGIAPSGTVFVRSCQRLVQMARSSELAALVVGNPDFRRREFPRLPRLPYAEAESRAVARLYSRAQLLIGSDATAQRFLSEAPRYEVVHFAGHAISNAERPALSRLLLAPDVGSDDSGVVFAEELLTVRFLRTRLVVLASCRTATGAASRGEGTLSLARPFLAAGVPQVLGTLWNIDDRAGSNFFTSFHEEVRSGMSPLQALRDVQLARIADGKSSPSQWAAYEVLGGASI
jgi:CHAT domain-containing protein